MNATLRLAAIGIAAALTLGAAPPAAACSLVAITPDFIARSVKAGEAAWVGRVSAVTVERTLPREPDFAADGKATIAVERRIRGRSGTEVVVPYNANPFCGYPWSPRVGDRLLVIRLANGGPHLFTEAQVAGSRYARYFETRR